MTFGAAVCRRRMLHARMVRWRHWLARGMRFEDSKRPESCNSRFVCELAAANMPYPNRWFSSRKIPARNSVRSATAVRINRDRRCLAADVSQAGRNREIVGSRISPRCGPASGVLRRSWVNGQRRTRARTPNEDYFYTAGKAPPIVDPQTGKTTSSGHVAFRFKAGDMRPFENLDEAVVVVYQSWEVGHQRVASIDEKRRVVTFRSPLPWAFDYWGGDVRYFVENVPEALDSPGEWYLDRTSGLLSYIPFPDEDLTRATVVAPVAQQLIVLQGEPARQPIRVPLAFREPALLHTDWEVPPQGHAAAQAACDFPGAVEATGARNCTLENCEIAHVGTYGVWFPARQGCQRLRGSTGPTCAGPRGWRGADLVREGSCVRGTRASRPTNIAPCDNSIHPRRRAHLPRRHRRLDWPQRADNQVTHMTSRTLYYTGDLSRLELGLRPDGPPSTT